MSYLKLLSKQIPAGQIANDIKRTIAVIYSLPVENYNSDVFHDVAVGFKNIVYNMEAESTNAFPLFLKWMKLYVKLQHRIDPKNETLFSKFEKKIPLCTSYIVASLQYQTKIANYHLQALEMCLSLFNNASDATMEIVATLKMDIIALFWMPIEFVGDYNTQKMSLKLIVKILSYLNEDQKRMRVNEIKTISEIKNLLLKLTEREADFEKVSRELLNHFNMKATKNCAVFSVYCRSALFGCYELFKPKDTDRFWIDFNYTTKSVSVFCEVKLKGDVQETISIQIKIDKLQIENQFDCIVLSIEPAIFSKPVSTELSNTRIAVFTLPQSEVQRLLANKDLVDFYNSTSNCHSSDLVAPASQNTINNFLAEEEEEEESSLNAPKGTQQSGGASILENRRQSHTPKKKSRTTEKSNIKSKSSAVKPSPVATSDTSKKKVTPVPNPPTFKVPANPVVRRPSEQAPSKKVPKSSQQPGPSTKRPRGKNTPKHQGPIEQQNESGSGSKRFFKASGSKPVDLPRTQPKPKSRKKPTSIRSSGISPKRKQVNTVRPLNHLTQPNCDPQEAALEYVENGGYANIMNFIQSSAGLASFNDQQRQQILENLERINEDLDRSSRRFFPKALSSGTESGDDAGGSKSRRKRCGTSKDAEPSKFVPFPIWKAQQKQKSKSLPRKPPVPEKCKATPNAFDQLKGSSGKDPTPSPLADDNLQRDITGNAKNRPSSSASSESNHNFFIVDSDNEMEGSDMDITPADMERRHEPQNTEHGQIRTPIQATRPEYASQTRKKVPRSPQLLQASMSSCYSEVDETPVPSGIVCELEKDWASEYQASEIYEDVYEDQTNKHHPTEPEYSSGTELSASHGVQNLQSGNQSTKPSASSADEEISVHSSNSSRRGQHAAIITPHGVGERNNWYIEKYLNDQQLFNQSPINVQALAASPPPPRASMMSTNQVIIQNQILVSACRKRSSPPHEDTPFSKMSLPVDRAPFKGCAQLLPEYKKKLTAEKNRLLHQLQSEHEENYFEKLTQIADEVVKTMTEHETEINEVQEQLSFCWGRLEWLIENQQKKRSQLEEVCKELISRIKSSIPKKQEVSRAYEVAEDELRSCAASTGSQLWQDFANNIVSSIESRLRDLVNF